MCTWAVGGSYIFFDQCMRASVEDSTCRAARLTADDGETWQPLYYT